MSHPAAVLQTFQADGRTIRLQYMTPDDGAALLEFARSVPRHDLLFLRTDITTVASDYLASNPLLETFAQAVPLTVDVPNIANATEIWQTFRDAWGEAVQSGQGDLATVIRHQRVVERGGDFRRDRIPKYVATIFVRNIADEADYEMSGARELCHQGRSDQST